MCCSGYVNWSILFHARNRKCQVHITDIRNGCDNHRGFWSLCLAIWQFVYGSRWSSVNISPVKFCQHLACEVLSTSRLWSSVNISLVKLSTSRLWSSVNISLVKLSTSRLWSSVNISLVKFCQHLACEISHDHENSVQQKLATLAQTILNHIWSRKCQEY